MFKSKESNESGLVRPKLVSLIVVPVVLIAYHFPLVRCALVPVFDLGSIIRVMR